MDIDKLDDWRVVTLDYQACGVVLVECGDMDRYDHFCQAAIANFAGTPNGDAAARILKTCLLVPESRRLVEPLRPMAEVAEKFFEPMVASNFPRWAAIPMSLWKYRSGDYAKAAEWCQRGLDFKDKIPAPDATLRIILAMSCYQRGQTNEAHSELAQGRRMVEEKFQNGLDRGTAALGYWHDWVFANILLREATELIEGSPRPAD